MLQRYFIGVSWFILSLISSSLNDIMSKYLGGSLSPYEITFFRFFFGAVTLVPFLVKSGGFVVGTKHAKVHFFRGALLFIGIACWTRGLQIVPIVVATLVSFTVPIFVLLIGVFFLYEKIIWQRWVAVIIGFIGIVFVLNPSNTDFGKGFVLFLISSISFATLDVINKNFVMKENTVNMIFYSNLFTFVVALFFFGKDWAVPSLKEVSVLIILGINANLILFFLLKAFRFADATAIAPYRYVELLISSIGGYLVFGEVPGVYVAYGSFVIVISTFFLIYSENKHNFC